MEKVEAEWKNPDSAIPLNLKKKAVAAYFASFGGIIASFGKYR